MPTLLFFAVPLPLLGALALFAMPKADHRRARSLALITALLTLGAAALLCLNFKAGPTTPQFTLGPKAGPYGFSWIGLPGGPGIRYALGLDGISVGLFALTALLTITAIFSSWESVTEKAPAHYALILMLETGLLGLFSSLDVILFYLFFEFTLIPLFFLIGIYGGSERRRAAVYFFLYTLAGSLLTLLGAVLLVFIHRQYSPGNVLTFSIPDLTAGLAAIDWAPWRQTGDLTWTSPQVLVFLLLFAGFAVKVPLFPFHTWLPLAHVEAPTAGSILLAGVLLKVGTYGLLRFNMAMTPLGAMSLFPLLATLSVIGILYGALAALAQSDAKKLVAYSSVSHMGFIALGIFSMTPVGMEGATVQMINHGLTTGALFAAVGMFYERYHTREMDKLGGLWERLPLLAFFLIVASLGSAAVPGLNGFVGEFPILLGAFDRSRRAGVFAALGMVLGAYYLLMMLQKVVFGPLKEPHESGHDHGPIRPVGWHEVAGLMPLIVLIVGIGVYPKPILDAIKPSVDAIARRFPQPQNDSPTTAAATGPRITLAHERRR